MLLPRRFLILRDVENSSKTRVPVVEKPEQVWTLMNENEFYQQGLRHLVTAFIEDPIHDWDWRDGVMRFYAHSSEPGEKANLVLVYEK